MKISIASVGPIVGHTTGSSSRIWLRGAFQQDEGGVRRCYGVVRYRRPGDQSWSAPQFNKLEAHFDMTGVFVLNGLNPVTTYEYQAGWFFADADLDKVQQMADGLFDWPGKVYSFRSGTSPLDRRQRHYAVGSCRYLLRLFGGTVFDERGDKCFKSIVSQIADGQPLDAMLMVGDQIYADDLKFIGKDRSVDDFLERYRTVFGQPAISELMAQVPTYMILDDHEIEDNWPHNASKRDRLTMYPHAVHAYQIYQCSHSPIFEVKPDGRLSGTLLHFWYKFSDGCADWFVLDARTERQVDKGVPQMIGEVQMQALLDWLGDGSGRIKFVVSSVPFIPDLNSDSADKWGAFPQQRDRIIAHIVDKAVPKVVFVSGDVHSSFTCRLELGVDPNFCIHQIVSSSFFWPYPHMGEKDFAFGIGIETVAGVRYRVRLTSEVHAEDNFARIRADDAGLLVTFYSRKGDELSQANIMF